MLEQLASTKPLLMAALLIINSLLGGEDANASHMQELQTLYAQAQIQADYIIKTGDMSQVEGLEDAMQMTADLMGPLMQQVNMPVLMQK